MIADVTKLMLKFYISIFSKLFFSFHCQKCLLMIGLCPLFFCFGKSFNL